MPIKKVKINSNLSDSGKSFNEQLDEIRRLVEENINYTKNFHQTKHASESSSQRELRQLLQENLKISKDLHGMTAKINKWIIWQRVWGIVKILIIIIPIVLGLIYLPSLLQQAFQPYQNFFNLESSFSSSQDKIIESLRQ